MAAALSKRVFRRALVAIAVAGLLLGLAAWGLGRRDIANWCWAGGTLPVVAGLLVSMIRDFLAGRLGVDAVAFVSMSGALTLGQNLAGIIIAIMYAGGNILEDFAVARAERDLRSLIDRAPKIAHRRAASAVKDVPIEQVAVGDNILVHAGEVVPVDGVIVSPVAMLDEAAVTGEPIPVSRQAGELARSGSLNAGETFELRASTTAHESTYAGIVRMVRRRADRKGAVRAHCRPLCAALVAAHPDHGWRSMVLLWRSDPGACGVGRLDALPAYPGGSGRLHRWRGASRQARHSR